MIPLGQTTYVILTGEEASAIEGALHNAWVKLIIFPGREHPETREALRLWLYVREQILGIKP